VPVLNAGTLVFLTLSTLLHGNWETGRRKEIRLFRRAADALDMLKLVAAQLAADNAKLAPVLI
jgi:hypothetical protein